MGLSVTPVGVPRSTSTIVVASYELRAVERKASLSHVLRSDTNKKLSDVQLSKNMPKTSSGMNR